MKSIKSNHHAIHPHEVGVVFVGPIIGLPKSLLEAFALLTGQGVTVEGIDIFDERHEKKTFLKVLGLTVLPGKNARLIQFANAFNEDVVFAKIDSAIRKLLAMGKQHIVLGGMSGGFVFASRIVQSPPDADIRGHSVLKHASLVSRIFGISPIVLYPGGVHRKGADLTAIPSSTSALLIFGNADQIVPRGTIEHCEQVSARMSNVSTVVINHENLQSNTPVRHQFFGGKDFIGFMKNIYWHPVAEAVAIHALEDFILGSPVSRN